jgi:hypothetical protein
MPPFPIKAGLEVRGDLQLALIFDMVAVRFWVPDKRARGAFIAFIAFIRL